MNEFNSKQLRRTRKGRIIAGVCSGVGEYVGIDANLIRIGLAVLTLFGGLGIGVYAIGWLLMPEEGKETSIVQDLVDKQQHKSHDSGNPWGGDEHKPQQ
jgi:phage shock protein C